MASTHCGSDQEVFSNNHTKPNLPNNPYTSADASESQTLLKLEPDLATDLNNRSRKKPWRPFTLRAPTLMASILITVALIGLMEWINKICVEEKALFFAERAEEFSTGIMFCYRYLPQMIVVALGVGWATVDLDVKRLEPYFQLSKRDGATASNSLFLHYPYDFIAFVPINAARKGHWSVFCSGLALCVIFWVVTPLNSSLLTTQLVARDIETSFKPFQKLTPFDDQAAAMSGSFLYTSYGIAWLGEKVHSFMTKELIAIPFKPASYAEGQNNPTRGKEYWTARTRVYQTELACTPAEIKPSTDQNGTRFDFNTDKCTYTTTPPLSVNVGTRTIMYIGFSNRSRATHLSMSKTGCKDPNLFLAIWAKLGNASNSGDEPDINALYCKPSYYYQTYEVTVDGADGSVLEANPVGERTNFTQEDKIIDIMTFGGNVDSVATLSGVNAKHFAPESPYSTSRLDDWHLVSPTVHISYLIGLSPGKRFDDFKDPRVFRDGLERMHRVLFNCALETLLVPYADAEGVLGRRVVRSVGIVVVPLIAHILAVFLGVVVACLCGVFVITYNRQNNMAGDPDTLGTKMALVAHSKTLLRDFDGADECPDPHLAIEPRKYKLGTWGSEDGYQLGVVGGRNNQPVQTPHAACALPHNGRLVRPIELSIWMGLAAALVNGALLALLIFLYKSALRYNGLPTLSDTQIVTQIIFSFVPTVIATLLEPFWVLVGRYLALYQPYTELQRGNASPDFSLGLKYTHIPPVLIAPRALRHGHIILFLASMMIITANFLAVAFGGIFDRGFKPLTSDLIVSYPFTTSINTEIQTKFTREKLGVRTFAQDIAEHWLVVNTNVIEGTELPAWVTEEFYFLPFVWDKPTNKSDLRTSMTQGYGGNLTCELLAADAFQQTNRRKGVNRGPSFGINVTIPISDGGSVRCTRDDNIMDMELLRPGTHPFAAEWVWGLQASDGSDEEAVQACRSKILAGWGRGEANRVPGRDVPDTEVTGPRTSITMESTGNTTSATMKSNTAIICSQQISTGEFKVTVDGEGRVKGSKLIGELRYNDPGIFNHSTTIGNFTEQLAILFRIPPGGKMDFGIMHNDNSSHSFSQFIGECLINKTLSDPATPPPSFEDAQKALSMFYKRFVTILFAQNHNRIFVRADKVPRSKVGELESLQPRVSMDPVMFYIAAAILGFQLIAGAIIFMSRPRRFLPRFPYNLASEISFFHASSALSDVAGTANMSSAMRSRHLNKLGWTYGYGKFRGSDGKKHVGIERMSLIKDYKEATHGRE
ncbi:hypothetical protein HOY80DRAFT_1140621 [Tuber brumale]|nr:hypothetical protein HOY80DRAFT_1140621 [Tuber brumale]